VTNRLAWIFFLASLGLAFGRPLTCWSEEGKEPVPNNLGSAPKSPWANPVVTSGEVEREVRKAPVPSYSSYRYAAKISLSGGADNINSSNQLRWSPSYSRGEDGFQRSAYMLSVVAGDQWKLTDERTLTVAAEDTGGFQPHIATNWEQLYIRPAPIVPTMQNDYWLVVGAAKSEDEGRQLLSYLKLQHPKYGFALFSPSTQGGLWGVMLATWISREEAQRLLPEALEINSHSFIWSACGTLDPNACRIAAQRAQQTSATGFLRSPPIPDQLLITVPTIPPRVAEEPTGLWERTNLLGDIGGLRDVLA
jgi:hypothetical protein